MVEQITGEAIRRYTENLESRGLLGPGLRAEIEALMGEMDRFSNWTEAGGHLESAQATHLTGSGPMSKFLRTLAYALERLEAGSQTLKEGGIQISRILLSDTFSGCSDFQGKIQVHGYRPDSSETVLLEGCFVWDCGAQGLPQPQAAEQMGYRCMVSFPSLSVLPEPS